MSSHLMRPETNESVVRRSATLTSALNIVNSVPAWVSGRHLRSSHHKRLACHSSSFGVGDGAGSVKRIGPMTARSFLVQRRTISRSYAPPVIVSVASPM